MFQKKCIVCEKYKLNDEFGDELEEKTGYGLICRDCLIDRQFLPTSSTFNISDHLPAEPEEFLSGEAEQEAYAFTDQDFLKTRIDSLNISSTLRSKLQSLHVRTLNALRLEYTDSDELTVNLNGLNESEQIEIIHALKKFKGDNKFSFRKKRVSYGKIFTSKSPALDEQETKDDTNSVASEVDLTEKKIQKILELVAESHNVTPEEIISISRVHEIVEARFFLVFVLKKFYNVSFSQIGRLLKRDHTTIINAYKKYSEGGKEHFDSKSLFIIFSKVKKFNYESKKAELRKVVEKEKFSVRLPDKVENTLDLMNGGLAYRSIPERNLKILHEYKKGATLEEISDKFNLTRQRVEQIVLKVLEIIATRDKLIRGDRAPAIVKAIEIEKVLHNAARQKKQVKKRKPSEKKPYNLKGWSRYYERCVKCGSTKIKHYKNGLCEVCGNRSIRGEEREKIISEHAGKCDVCGIDRNTALSKFGRDFYLRRDERSVLCQGCFRKETGKILGNRVRQKKAPNIPFGVKYDTGSEWIYKNKKTFAQGKYDGNKFIVLKNSVIDPAVRVSYRKHLNSVRQRENILHEKAGKVNGVYILNTDIEFYSSSQAATFCGGGNENGWTAWKRISDGKTLDEVYRRKDIQE